MLILSRMETEKICIGDEITITVVKIRGYKVRIAIDAPPHIKVLRAELKEHDENHSRSES